MRIYSIVISMLGSLLPTTLLYGEDQAPKNELAFGLGGLTSISRSTAPDRLDLGPGVGLQVNYGRRIVTGKNVALYGEVHFVARPLRDVYPISHPRLATSLACMSRRVYE